MPENDEYDYDELLKRGREQLPESASSGERFEIPKVKGHIQGNRTIINNFYQIASVLGREPEHLLKFILKELATPGDLVKTGMIIGSKVSAARINEKIEQYAKTYVICTECKKPDTKLIKEGPVTFIVCQACGAKHPVKS